MDGKDTSAEKGTALPAWSNKQYQMIPLVHLNMWHDWDSNPINVPCVNGKQQEQTELYSQYCHTNNKNVMHCFTQELGKVRGRSVNKRRHSLHKV
jgi:hypothetical protein